MTSAVARRDSLSANLHAVRARMAAAAERGGRSADEITLCAVTKYVPRPVVEGLLDLGVTVLGENRVQAAEGKVVRRDGVSWHMIGHLQRNKAKKAVALFDLVQSVDSLRLAEKLSEEACRAGRVLAVLLEANISGEEAKTGLPEAECDAFFGAVPALPGLELRGVMGMAPLQDDPEGARPSFRRARAIRDRGRDLTGLPLRELSLGMSADFEVAIEEGATIVRVGSALYGGVI